MGQSDVGTSSGSLAEDLDCPALSPPAGFALSAAASPSLPGDFERARGGFFSAAGLAAAAAAAAGAGDFERGLGGGEVEGLGLGLAGLATTLGGCMCEGGCRRARRAAGWAQRAAGRYPHPMHRDGCETESLEDFYFTQRRGATTVYRRDIAARAACKAQKYTRSSPECKWNKDIRYIHDNFIKRHLNGLRATQLFREVRCIHMAEVVMLMVCGLRCASLRNLCWRF